MTTLDALLNQKGILIVPGAYDALSARVAVHAGAEAVYMTGFGVVGASFGVPDIGLVGPDQMAERVRAIAGAAAPVPLIADGDNGHGGPASVARLVCAYEQAGAACIQLEDQASPKRCGHMDGKEVVPLADAVAKIRSAASARSHSGFKIMARTDARQTHGLDEALLRGEAFLKAGADILFVEAPQSEDELRIIAERFAGTPLVANLVEDGKTPVLAPATLQQMGFRIALYPISSLLAITQRLEDAYTAILAGNGIPPVERSSFRHYNDLVGLPEWQSLEDRSRSSD
ncbi:MAG: isocitrate lyase/PEP mutase family protein [Rhizomicrobium sp.]|jgi:2-methylisocitrate lyase-like PEP mutase family enzyme